MDRPSVPGRQLVFQGNEGLYTVFNVNTKNAGMTGVTERLSGLALWSVDIATTSNATQFQMQNNPTYGAVVFTQKFRRARTENFRCKLRGVGIHTDTIGP